MANQGPEVLDECFRALAHPIRRGILERLMAGPATVGTVSEPFDVAAPTISKHVSVLEDAGLVTRKRVGRQHYLALRGEPLEGATSWLADARRTWNERFDALEELVASLGALEENGPDKDVDP